MCLILFAWKKHPKYDLIVAANRDEFYDRPTQKAHIWPEEVDLIAGKDLKAGGTWMGISKSGKFAALTNYRDPKHMNPEAPSRGDLTKDFLKKEISPASYLQEILSENIPYNGFNLLLGDSDSLYYYNNINNEIKELEAGIYGLSNALLNDPWPKVINGKVKLEEAVSNENLTPSDLFNILRDRVIAPDHELPHTGVPMEWERALSSMYIETENYGTRCSTVLIQGVEKTIYSENSHAHLGQKEDQVEFIL